jgi:hypothetical protein
MSSLNRSDLLLAHRYRLSLQRPPRQSRFRVVALIFLEKESLVDSKNCPPVLCWDQDRPYLLGTNDEACWIGNSICAERAALALLRWFPTAKVEKIVIVSDAPHPIAPGCLCREFMASCDQVPWDVPIILGGAKYQENPEENLGVEDVTGMTVTLDYLYPYPSLFLRSCPLDCLAFGQKWYPRLKEFNHSLLRIARSVFEEEVDDTTNLHPISYVAVVLFRDKTHAYSSCIKSLEYGCSQDAITQLAPVMTAKRAQGVEPIQLVQVDQFGIAHPPFAPARAFLVEQQYDHVSVFIHIFEKKLNTLMWKTIKASDLAPMSPNYVANLYKEDSSAGEKSIKIQDVEA